MAELTEKQRRAIAKHAREFQRRMQSLVDKNKSGITGLSMEIAGKMVEIAKKGGE